MAHKSEKKLKAKIKNKVFYFLSDNSSHSYDYKIVAKKLGFHQPIKKKLIFTLLEDLVREGKVSKKDDLYQIKPDLSTQNSGIIDFTSSGAAYIIVDNKGEDIYIAKGNTKNALHGDTVSFYIDKKSKKTKIEGKVKEVLKRNRKEFVGTIEISSRFAFVVPDNKRIQADFFIDAKKTLDAKNGDKVLVEMTDWPLEAKNPYAKVIKVLGKSGETGTEMNAIMEDFQLPYEFPEEVLEAAKNIDVTISKEEIAKRRDFRKITTFTIDPVDAKDFDDALSLQVLENGNYEIGVHIADVSHYVTPGSIIDKEAIQRATSVYLVDRVVPMLPEVLSNQVCSLRPNEEKLCFSAVFELDEKANIKNKWFGRTVINSTRRFTYEEAQTRIETKKGDYQKEINVLDGLAKILRKKRMENGALDIISSEVKFVVDENGKPTGVAVKTSKDANKLIEEFMLLANKHVAMFVGKPEKGKITHPMVYRVHDNPSAEKIADLRYFLHDFGYELKEVADKPLSYSLNILLHEAIEREEVSFIGPLVIRSMAKAEYTTENIGHYGLAFDYYTHFTSPIRRYPDVEVHRILQNYLDKNKPKQNAKELEKSCVHYSTQEKKATDAERASIKFMQVVYMSDKVGFEFDGTVSGVAKYGIFVEDKASKCEGMIHISEIKQDNFYYDDKKNQLVGRKYGDIIKMGTPVRIRVVKTDLLNRTIDFDLLDYEA